MSQSAEEVSHASERITWVMGHKNPDTDAICSAMAYADLLQQTRYPNAKAACCGPPNSRTEWVLRRAGLSAPPMKSNVYPKALDICTQKVVTAAPDDSVIDAYLSMTTKGHRSLPVTTNENVLIGMLSLLDLLELLIPSMDAGNQAREVTTTTKKIGQILDAESIYLTDYCDLETDFLMMVAGSSEPVMKERIDLLPSDRLLIITGDRVGVQLHAVEAGVRCLVITSGFRPSEAIIAAAKNSGTAILVTNRDTASTTQLIRGARPIHQAISKDFIAFAPETSVHKVKEEVNAHPQQALFPVCSPKTKTLLGVFSRTNLVNPERPRLVLVDHNEFSQAVAGADEAEIVEVMDHHRLSGNLVTRDPVQFINKPVGSTCTIVGRAFQNNRLAPRKEVATLICAGIISDTLNLTSPTATEEDKRILDWASEIAKIDVNEFTDGFFSVGSVLRSGDAEQAVLSDRKEFDEKGYRLSISQVEEIGFNYFWPARECLQQELRKLVETNGLDFACLMITDISNNNSLLLVEGPERVRKQISYPREDDHLYILNSIVSRKKQLFPYISMLLGEIPKN